MVRVLGIDPGLNQTGYAIVECRKDEFKIAKSGLIKTLPSAPLPERIHKIYHELFNIITSFSISLAGIEDTYVNNNYSSSLKLAHARASAILAVTNSNVAIKELSSKTVKKTITGSGAADKAQIEKMINLTLGITKEYLSHDESDAVAIALCLALTTRS